MLLTISTRAGTSVSMKETILKFSFQILRLTSATYLEDFDDHHITDSVDIFEEIDISFDININKLDYQSELDSNFDYFYDDMHTYVA